MANGESATITIVVILTDEGSIENQVTVSGNEEDSNLKNNMAREKTEVIEFEE